MSCSDFRNLEKIQADLNLTLEENRNLLKDNYSVEASDYFKQTLE